MKITQQGAEFVPITLVLETKEEAAMLWNMMFKISREAKKYEEASMAASMAAAIADWISSEAHL